MSTSNESATGDRLSAILHADMVDYSVITARSDAQSRRCVEAIKEAFEQAVLTRGGWVRAKAGDAVLALLASPTAAVEAAIEVQKRLADVRSQCPDLPLWLRIGAHMGVVTPSGDDWHGHSINTTARIQGEALHGGLTLSNDVYQGVRNKLDLVYQDLGDCDLKGVGVWHLYRVVIGTERPAPPPWHQRVLVYRRELGAAAVFAGLGAWAGPRLVEWWTRPPEEGPRPTKTLPPIDEWPLKICVMEITPVGETPAWMSEITHKGLNALLTKFEKLQVFSKERIDFVKEKTGKKSFDIAQELGVTRMINGDLIRSGVKVTLEARIIDRDTGLIVYTCEASGTEDNLVEIQNKVVLDLVAALKVPTTRAEVDRALAARTNVDLDVTKRFAEAFGGEEPEGDAAPAPTNAPGAWRLSWPSEAHAQTPEEQNVKKLLERYREALQAKDLQQLAAIYVSLSDNTRQALERYFQSADALTVEFSAITVLFEGDEALATFTRSDKFKDLQTGRDVNLEVRVSTVVAKADGSWKIKALRKPSS
jgi:class 3 adenylate cyclase/TolB-like protein/ketosteroid isomerase-like protein